MRKNSSPNVIIIIADDLGYGDIGIYGNADIKTPNLDRLAENGVRLSQHYSGSPLCAPARAALLTGRYNNRVGALSVESNRAMDRIGLEEATFADIFKNAGYVTGMVGKWHNGLFDRKHHPNSRGFDEFTGFLNGGMSYYDWILDCNGSPVKSDGTYLTDYFTSEAVDFIERHKNHPFCLYLAYNAPHDPLEVPADEEKLFSETGNFNRTVCKIYGLIKRMDTGIGKIMDKLQTLGIKDNTIILFTSDNGPFLGGVGEDSCMRYNGPFRGQKNFVLEGGIRVPAIISWTDGLPQNTECHDMVHFTDWMPTLLSAVKIEPRPVLPLDGINVLEALQDERSSLKRSKLFWQHNRNKPVSHCNAAMRDGPWKLVWDYPAKLFSKSDDDDYWYRKMFTKPHFMMDVKQVMLECDCDMSERPLLYNIELDPYESQDLSLKYPDRTDAMKRELEEWFELVEAERKTKQII